jgi:hypothetical protein
MTRIKILEFNVGDVDDINLVAGMIVESKLKSTKQGQWALDNSKDIRYSISERVEVLNYIIRVEAEVEDSAATYFNLRWR